MKKTLLTICVLLLASWNAVVAQVNPAKVHKIGDRAALTLSAEFNQLQVKDKGVKADSEEETWVVYAVGTYLHGATYYVHLDYVDHTFENMLGANLPAAKYESTLYRSSKNSNKYKISPWANGSEMVFSVDNITGHITVEPSPVGFAGQSGNIFAFDTYANFGEHPSTYDVANGVFTFFIALFDNQYIYGVDCDQFVITEKYVVSGGTCGKNGGDNVIWQLGQTGELLIHGSGEMEDYVTDENMIERRPWEDLGGLISSIRIAKGVTNVGEGAFAFFEGATSIKISNSVTSIGKGAFQDCSGLTSIEFPNSVTSIGTSAMNRCSSLKNIFIPHSVESIGNYAFYGCSELQSVVMGNSVTTIGKGGFGGCDKLETIKMLGEIPPTAFDNTFSNYDATLYVPIGSAGIYRSADVWTNFSLIEEFDATGIENVEEIVGKDVSVYTTNGKLVQQIPNYNGAPLRLPKGVYVVRAGKETKKVLVK